MNSPQPQPQPQPQPPQPGQAPPQPGQAQPQQPPSGQYLPPQQHSGPYSSPPQSAAGPYPGQGAQPQPQPQPQAGAYGRPVGKSAPRPVGVKWGLVGFVAGAVLVGLVWVGTSALGGSGSGSASSDAAMACQIFKELPSLTQTNYEVPYTNRVSAASDLAASAAKQDSRYHQLSVDAAAAQQGVTTFNIVGVNKAVKAARGDC